MLKIRRFVVGRDEENWVSVWNAAYREYEDLRQMTVEEFEAGEKAPEFDREGRFIAELGGQPVGIVPKFRGRGIDGELAEIALKELRARGMTSVMLGVDDWNVTKAIKLYEKVGFKLARKDFTYERRIY